MNATTVAVDLAKTVFELAITDAHACLVERKRLSREAFSRFFANRPRCRIVMEACSTARFFTPEPEFPPRFASETLDDHDAIGRTGTRKSR